MPSVILSQQAENPPQEQASAELDFIEDKKGESQQEAKQVSALETTEEWVLKEEASDIEVSSDEDSDEDSDDKPSTHVLETQALSDEEEIVKEEAPRTRHEVAQLPPISMSDLLSTAKQVDPRAPLTEIGCVHGFVEDMLIVQSGSSGDVTVLDMDTIVFLQDKTIVGKIYDTFGPVQRPYYSIRLPSMEKKSADIEMTHVATTKVTSTPSVKVPDTKVAVATTTETDTEVPVDLAVTEPAVTAECMDAPSVQVVTAECMDTPSVQVITAEVMDTPSVEAVTAEVMDTPSVEAVTAEVMDTPSVQAITTEVMDTSPVQSLSHSNPTTQKSSKAPHPELQYPIGTRIFIVENLARYVFTKQIKAIKGSDASNMYDEEVAEEEWEFSDDEKEAEHKSRLKRKRRGQSEEPSAHPRRREKPSNPRHSQPRQSQPRQSQPRHPQAPQMYPQAPSYYPYPPNYGMPYHPMMMQMAPMPYGMPMNPLQQGQAMGQMINLQNLSHLLHQFRPPQ